jgi:hypothetical protein
MRQDMKSDRSQTNARKEKKKKNGGLLSEKNEIRNRKQNQGGRGKVLHFISGSVILTKKSREYEKKQKRTHEEREAPKRKNPKPVYGRPQ